MILTMLHILLLCFTHFPDPSCVCVCVCVHCVSPNFSLPDVAFLPSMPHCHSCCCCWCRCWLLFHTGSPSDSIMSIATECSSRSLGKRDSNFSPRRLSVFSFYFLPWDENSVLTELLLMLLLCITESCQGMKSRIYCLPTHTLLSHTHRLPASLLRLVLSFPFPPNKQRLTACHCVRVCLWVWGLRHRGIAVSERGQSRISKSK